MSSQKPLQKSTYPKLNGPLNPSRLHNNEINSAAHASLAEGDWSREKPIFKTVAEGDIEGLKKYISKNGNLTLSTTYGYSLLTLLAYVKENEKTIKTLKLIVEQGSDKLNKFSKNEQFTALLAAINKGNTGIAHYLLDQGASIKPQGQLNDFSILIQAAKKGFYKIITKVINRFPKHTLMSDLNAQDSDGCSALIHAALCGEKNFKRIVIDTGKLKNSDSRSGENNHSSSPQLVETPKETHPSKSAEEKSRYEFLNSEINYLETIKILLQNQADPHIKDKEGKNVLMIATQNKDITILTFLLSNEKISASINEIAEDGATAVIYALLHKNEAAFLKLVEYGADPTKGQHLQESSIISVALDTTRNLQIIKCILDKIPDLSRCLADPTILLRIANLQWIECLELLIHSGAKLNVRDKKNASILHFLVTSDNYLPVIKWVLQKAPELEHLKDNDGHTPLIAASHYGSLQIVKALVKNSELSTQDNNGDSALTHAAQKDRLDVVQFLVAQMKSKDIDKINIKGHTALLYALISPSENIEIIKTLLHEKVDVNRLFILNATLKDGSIQKHIRTPLMIAAAMGKAAVVELLLAYGAMLSFPGIEQDENLLIATQSGHLDTVKKILEALFQKKDSNKLDLDHNIFKALLISAKQDALQIFQYLIIHLKEISMGNSEKLSERILNIFKIICYSDKPSQQVLNALLSDKICLEIIKKYKNDLLFEAAEISCLSAVKLLLADPINADLNYSQSFSNINLLFISIANKDEALLTFLLERGIELDSIFNLPPPNDLSETEDRADTDSLSSISHYDQYTALMIELEWRRMEVDQGNNALASKILAKKIWDGLKEDQDIFIKQKLAKARATELQNEIIKIKNIIYQFSVQFIAYTPKFDKNYSILVSPQNPDFKIGFKTFLEIFKRLYGRQFPNLLPAIFSEWQNLLDESIKNIETLEHQKEALLLSWTNIELILLNFPDEIGGVKIDLFLKELQGNMETSKKGTISRIQDLIHESNFFLLSPAAQRIKNISRFQSNNKARTEKVAQILTEILKIQESHLTLKLKFIERSLQLGNILKEKLEREGLIEAKAANESLKTDGKLVEYRKEAHTLSSCLGELNEQLTKLEQDLLKQRKKEKTHLDRYDKEKNLQTQSEEEQVKLKQTQKIWEEKRKSEEAAFEEKLKQDQKALEENRAKFRDLKKSRQAYDRQKKAEQALKHRQETTSAIESSSKKNHLNNASAEFKTNTEELEIKGQSERIRRKLFPLTLSEKGSIPSFLGLKSDAIVLNQILTEIDSLSKLNLLKAKPENILATRNACLGLTARIAEVIYQSNGIPTFSKKDAGHFRDVIWHANKSLLISFEFQEILQMAQDLKKMVFDYLTGKKKQLSQSQSKLQNNKILSVILNHNLEPEKEPFSCTVYQKEYEIDRTELLQYKTCDKLSENQLEHAYGYSCGRIGVFTKRMQKYYPDFYHCQKHLQAMYNEATARYETELCFMACLYRHTQSNPQELQVTYFMQENTFNLMANSFSNSHSSSPSTPTLPLPKIAESPQFPASSSTPSQSIQNFMPAFEYKRDQTNGQSMVPTNSLSLATNPKPNSNLNLK